jgi:hypothetical protein
MMKKESSERNYLAIQMSRIFAMSESSRSTRLQSDAPLKDHRKNLPELTRRTNMPTRSQNENCAFTVP